MTEREIYKFCLDNGIELEHKKVSLYDLSKHYIGTIDMKRKYQVWSPKFTSIYTILDEAIDKFIQLKGD